jgi:hypothetical protein
VTTPVAAPVAQDSIFQLDTLARFDNFANCQEATDMKMDTHFRILFAGLLAISLLILPATTISLQAQEQPTKTQEQPAKKHAATKEVFKSKAKPGEAGATDPNVKNMEATNNPKAAQEKPPSHKGAKTRGFGPGVCASTIDNWTGWYVKFFVDGSFRGSVGPWDDGTVYVGSGATTLYARADFTDGTYKYWGPQVVNCPTGGQHIWSIYY